MKIAPLTTHCSVNALLSSLNTPRVVPQLEYAGWCYLDDPTMPVMHVVTQFAGQRLEAYWTRQFDEALRNHPLLSKP